ncbi:MAG: anhydro-N-acetylmuramic acid kinase [Ectothiorhodospiraceae bacterium]|nr:anhydro-N-acetylmuramic acid kinase [Ectothiorhodospiraceae bacterium]MCH8506220.1 anhydro-N-acetylmuramic acid kinase [Ectothiorhodospiraceae bacterium]
MNLDDALYIGLISGTSMDGVDAALVRFNDNRPNLVKVLDYPYEAGIRRRLLAVGAATPVAEIAELDAAVGETLANAVLSLLELAQTSPRDVTAIGSHGQTVWHAPAGRWANSLQIGDPNRIAQRTGITTVADLRRRDMAAGGQGAPLAPAFHQAFFGGESSAVVVNLGGIANISQLPGAAGGAITGFDTGPANVLMDLWAQHRFDRPYDDEGVLAHTGTVSAPWLEQLLREPYLAGKPPKSTGRELFNLEWLERHLALSGAPEDPHDVMATLCMLTARTVADAIARWADDGDAIYLCGGGAYNLTLIQQLQGLLPDKRIQTTEALGMEPGWVEAAGFAWLAREALAGRPGNEPGVTGADRKVVLGAVYPGG